MATKLSMEVLEMLILIPYLDPDVDSDLTISTLTLLHRVDK